jgi:hypothetical protein
VGFGHDRGGKYSWRRRAVPKLIRKKGDAGCQEPEARDRKRNSRQELEEINRNEKTEREKDGTMVTALERKGVSGPAILELVWIRVRNSRDMYNMYNLYSLYLLFLQYCTIYCFN